MRSGEVTITRMRSRTKRRQGTKCLYVVYNRVQTGMSPQRSNSLEFHGRDMTPGR